MTDPDRAPASDLVARLMKHRGCIRNERIAAKVDAMVAHRPDTPYWLFVHALVLEHQVAALRKELSRQERSTTAEIAKRFGRTGLFAGATPPEKR